MKHLSFIPMVVALLYADAAVAHDPEWLPGNRMSCDDVCRSAGKQPVSSGDYRSADARLHGQDFYVCAADAGDGPRAGYNLKPNWARGCWVGYGGKEKAELPYDCLCK